MKIELDTKNKTIILKEDINFKELLDELLEMKLDITEYTISANSILTYTPPWGTAPEFPNYPVYCLTVGGDSNYYGK